MLLLPFTIKLPHFYRGIPFLLFSLFVLQIIPAKAITTTQQIDSLENLLNVSTGEKKGLILGNLATLYSTTDTVKSFDYFKLYSNVKDSILSLTNKSRIEELQIKYDIDREEQKIAHQKIIIAQKKHEFFLSIAVGLLLLILTSLTIAFIIRTKKQREKILQQENGNLRKELELKNKELICNVSKIFTKSQVINKVAHRLIRNSGDFKQANTKLIREIISELKQNIGETGWKEFDIRFARVHENFYSELDRRFPDLTKTERKLCALLKLGMSSKEIAAIAMIRTESVDSARSLLRKKLGLSGDEGLFEFLKEL